MNTPALVDWLRERVPLYFNFHDKPVSYTWNPQFLAEDLLRYAPLPATPIPDTSAGERETIARALLRSRGAHTIASDEGWASSMAHYRDMCARYPDYADGSCLVNDVLRDADTMLAAIALQGPSGKTPGAVDE